MELQRLTADISVNNFDCDDEDLNGFLRDDAIPSEAKHIANMNAIPFYEYCGFKQLQPSDEDKDTRLMYFDMLSLIDQ